MENFATTTCTILDASTTECVTSEIDNGQLLANFFTIVIILMLFSNFIISRFIKNKNKMYDF